MLGGCGHVALTDPLEGPNSLIRAEATCSETGLGSYNGETEYGKTLNKYHYVQWMTLHIW